MRLVSFTNDDRGPRAGALVGNAVIDLHATDASLPATVRELLEAGQPALQKAKAAAAASNAVLVAKPRLHAPIPNPNKVLCIGLNYRDHAEETGAQIPRDPVVFNKFTTTVIGPDDPIAIPSVSSEVDYEAELVIVIGKKGRNIPVGKAMEYVAGYTVGHDVSARDWQTKKDGKQWLLGKSFDTFAPMGPAMVTADEVSDPHNLGIRFRLNGKTMQDSNTRQMIFKTPELIAYISQVCTLLPGDVIFTGTPPGVGMARKPPVYLKPGDVCEVEIDGLGVLNNPCVEG
ncbi:MAG: fumarylacetoacetate hydrolase family protein [Planctomycetota bacterium]